MSDGTKMSLGRLAQFAAALSLALSSWLTGLPAHAQSAESVCAQVKIEIKQELTLERQAFDAHMRINNGLDTVALENIAVNVTFEDESGAAVLATSDSNNTEASFFIRLDSLDGIDDVSGGGRVAPASSADIHWLIIPAPGASGGIGAGKLYFVGASLEYTLGGEPQTTEVTPDFIRVKPLPRLSVDYFLTRDVYADDPFTPAVESAEPFTLGVRIRNNGNATARNIRIDSAQPRIVENEQGLAIGFQIVSSQVNGRPVAPTLLVDFGDIGAEQAAVGRWQMLTNLSGRFVAFDAEFSHADELGGELTSLLDATTTHLLVRDVRVDLPGRDNVRDFLADDGDALRVYESDSDDVQVADQSGLASIEYLGQSVASYRYRISAPVTTGFMYARLADPLNGTKQIQAVTRSDGKNIPLENAWLSKTRNASNGWDHHLNLFDANGTGAYTLVFGTPDLGPRPPVLQFIADRVTYEGGQIGVLVEASDPNGTLPLLTVDPLPAGATFTDQGDGTAIFDWRPAVGQAGQYSLTFTASDGALTDARTAVITVHPAWDTDGDGMDDAWELAHFGTLDRDGTGDYDNDGTPDLEEYLADTDPTQPPGPETPVIQAPAYAAEVTELQPVLVVANAAHLPGMTVTYAFEVYRDEAMTDLAASVEDVAEGAETSSWQVADPLADNTEYDWRVRAGAGSVYSLWANARFFVNTANDPPNAFQTAGPADGTEVDSFTPTLAVTNALDVDRDAVSYVFAVYDDAGLGNVVATSDALAADTQGTTAWQINVPLDENALYYWRATATDEHGLATDGPVASFFVNTANEAPTAPGLVSPAVGAKLPADSVSLQVQNASDPDGDTLEYLFELDDVATFDGPDKLSSGAITEGADTTTWSVADLAEDAIYYWRVKASDGIAESAWVQGSFTVNAVNLAPAVPTVQNPGDLAWVATLSPTLSVNPVSDPDGDAVSYRFELYQDQALDTRLDEAVSGTGVWSPAASLSDNRWYYWRVRAEDEWGLSSEWSPVTRFFVDENGVDDPPEFTWVAPTVDAELTGDTYTLAWTDQDPDSSATIALYLDTDDIGADGSLIADGVEEDLDGDGDSHVWDVSALAPGTYHLYAVIEDASSAVTVYAPATLTVAEPPPASTPGDLDGNGVIDQADYNAFLATFGKCQGQGGFNAEPDYDGDGCITFVDYQIWYGYYSGQ